MMVLAGRSTAPEIVTERLRLRAHEIDDLEPASVMWADPVVTRHIGGRPSTQQQTWSRILNYAGHWSLLGYGYWAVEEKASGDFVGELGFADFKRVIDPRMQDAPEFGWAFAAQVHGKGYATEAARAALAWSDDAFTVNRTVCLINPENVPSVRVAEKCGYRMFANTVFGDRETLLFERVL